MDTAEASAMLEDLAKFNVPVVMFSGGEPLLREDIFELIGRATLLDLRSVLSTNGTLIDAAVADRLRQVGVGYVGVSLDGIGQVHDRFRGQEGAFVRALAGLRHCRQAGLKVGLRFTITNHNVSQLDGVFSLLADEDIPRACFYHLAPVGRGAKLPGGDLSLQASREALDRIIDHTAELHRRGMKKEILTVDNHADGPYLVLRLLREGSARAEEVLAMLKANGGNASGTGIGCVSWDGQVHPDQFWRHVSVGNVRERPFSQIWTDPSNSLLAALRDRRPLLKGRCRTCRFLDACGGNLRVRAEAAGDLWGDDPACYLTDEEIAATDLAL
jgi:radical SAM protein with 4Fe4S-binding SPASM domain